MKTLHVNIRVKDISESTRFYQELFGVAPSIEKADYVKWALDEPQANFSISLGKENFGVDHLGIEVSTSEELHKLYQNMNASEGDILEEGHTTCCYAQSEKSWVQDPQGVKWEAFHTYGESFVNKSEESACCDESCCVA